MRSVATNVFDGLGSTLVNPPKRLKRSRYHLGRRVDSCLSQGTIHLGQLAVSVLVGPCCPAPLNCIDVDVRTVVLLGK